MGIASALVVCVLGLLGGLHGLERSAMNALFHARGERTTPSRIVILLADDQTVARFQVSPLPLGVYAQAVERLNRLGAKTIVFLPLVQTRSGTPDDARLERVCRESGRVLQTATFDTQAISESSLDLQARFAVAGRAENVPRAWQVAAALPALQNVAPALGHLNLRPEPDGAVRRIPHLFRYRERLYPSIALAAAAHYLDIAPRDIRARESDVSLAPPADSRRHIPLGRNGETWINWLGREHTFPTYSFLDLLDHRLRERIIKDSLVIVAMSRAGTFAPLATPFSERETPVELQANAIDDILTNRLLREIPTASQWLLLFGFALVCGALVGPRGAVGSLAWTLFLGLALWLAACWALQHDWYVPVAAPLLAGVLTCGMAVGVRQMREARELVLVRTMFGAHVGADVLRQLGNRPPELGGEVRHIAVLFSDIRGFSALAEELRDEPEELLGLLNAHFDPLVQSLQNHGAHVDNYVGDLVMALFGAPISAGSPDSDTRNAVLAAVDFVRIVDERNRERRKWGERVIEVGIGVHSGPAVVGRIGRHDRMHYTAIGDTVVIGSRVESATRQFDTPLLVTGEVVRACRDHVSTSDLQWEAVSQTTVKGRVGTVELFRCTNLSQNGAMSKNATSAAAT